MSKNNRRGVVYSTKDDFSYEYEQEETLETLPPNQQTLRILLDRKARKGKTVTLIEGFIGTEEDLKDLAKVLKSKCGVGGSAKNGEIIIQGEFRDKVMTILAQEGYNTKRVGG
ncbi:translation initiation factor [Prolixibacteraceae bacterium]|nr:translation initiation factor [Prolixibacteraceae bacterium]